MHCSLARYIGLSSVIVFSYLQAAWTPPIDLSVSGQSASASQIALDAAGNASAVWMRFDGSNNIIQASTKPYGGSWQETPDTLSSTGKTSTSPRIAVDPAGNATAVWTELEGPSNCIIQASTKPFGGYWQATPDSLSAPGQDSGNLALAVDLTGNAIAVWERSDGSHQIIQASTKLFGGSWQETPDNLSSTAEDVFSPHIAVDSAGNATAVWVRSNGSNSIIQASTKPYGGSWQDTPDNLSAEGQNAYSPRIAIDSADNAIAVWARSNGSHSIIQASTKPYGGSWQKTPENLSAEGQNAENPKVAVDSAGNATAVWMRSNGFNSIIQASTKPYGGSWQETGDNLSAKGQDALSPQIVIDCAGNATAMWERFDGSNYIIQASTKSYGGSWQETPDNLSATGQNASSPHIAMDSVGEVTIAVWQRFDGSNNIIQASDRISAPQVPPYFHGRLERIHHHTHRWVLRTFWKPSQSRDVVRYRIYKGSKVVGTVSPNGKLKHKNYLRWRKSTKKFKVAAVNSQNQESAKTTLKIED